MLCPGGHPCLASVLDWIMMPLARLRPGVVRGATGRVLEVGAGTGLNFDLYAPGVSIDAVEPDPHMVRRARERIGERDIRLHTVGAEAMPFDDDVFDTVVITFALCTIPEVDRALQEIRRVSRPGAEVRFAEHVGSSVGWIGATQRLLDPVWNRMAGGCYLTRNPLQALQDAGFGSLDVRQRGSVYSPLPVITGTARVPEEPGDAGPLPPA